jgi:hypothetical protein
MEGNLVTNTHVPELRGRRQVRRRLPHLRGRGLSRAMLQDSPSLILIAFKPSLKLICVRLQPSDGRASSPCKLSVMVSGATGDRSIAFHIFYSEIASLTRVALSSMVTVVDNAILHDHTTCAYLEGKF